MKSRTIFTLTLPLIFLFSARAFVPCIPPASHHGQWANLRLTHPPSKSAGVLAQSGFSKRQQRRRCLFMGWGPDPIWSDACVSDYMTANPSGSCMTMILNVPKDISQQYKFPGQYIQLRSGTESSFDPLFLAIASAPNSESGKLEFLIKPTVENSWVTTLTTGDMVEISQVLGRGFGMKESWENQNNEYTATNILMFGAGSGIAPIKAAMESDQLNLANGGRSGRLYYGARTADDLCFLERFSKWEDRGFEVVPVLSKAGPRWNGRTGYIQNCLQEDGIPSPRTTGAILCGMVNMTESVSGILTKAGVHEDRILMNF